VKAIVHVTLKPDVLDRNVAVILDLIQRTPAFRKYARSDAPDLKAHAQVGREAAAGGMVLLKNSAVLPLAKGTKLALLGNGSYNLITGGTGSGDVNEAYSISLLQGIKDGGLLADSAVAEAYAGYLKEQEAKQPPRQPFMPVKPIAERMASSDELARLARETDLALLTISRSSGEFADRKRENDFDLSEVEKALIRDTATAFHARNKKLLVVLNIGGVIETESWRHHPDAILLAWQPGQEAGHAVADLLLGHATPSGKLATTFPVKWEDVPSSANFPGRTLMGRDPNSRNPLAGDRAAEVVYEDDIWVGYRHFATRGVKTSYPFGFGLSYTTFQYSNLSLSASEFGKELTASVTVRNTGSAVGREVVQVYLTAPGNAIPKPALELRAFAKTKALKPGEAETLTFTLTPRDLASFDAPSSSWVAEAGTYTVKVGASSEDIKLTAIFTKARAENVASVSASVGPVTP